jgi:hypothetical protein
MTAFDFSDNEPVISGGRTADVDLSAGNAAFYQRLQGQTKKKGIERFGWVALPVGAVAILGIVALTSTPHESKNDVVGAPGQQTAAVSKPAPGPAMTPKVMASNDAVSPTKELPASQVKAEIEKGPTLSASSAKPAPVKTARAAPARSTSSDSDVRPAAAAPAQRAPSNDAQLNAAQVQPVTPPAPSATATPTAPAAAIPAPTETAPAPVTNDATQSPSIAAPAPAAPALDPAPAAAAPAQ